MRPDECHLVSSLREQFCRLVLWPLLVLQMLVISAFADESLSKVAVAATVNGTAITVQDFRQELDRLQRKKGKSAKIVDEAAVADLKREALENIIIRELLFQESIKQKISIDASLIDREMEQLRGKFATPAQFAESLQRINTVEALVRKQVARGLAINVLIDRSVAKDVVVSDEEMKEYYEQHLEDFTKQPQVTSPLSDVRDKVRNLVRQEKSLIVLQRYVKNLRDAAKVEIHLAGD